MRKLLPGEVIERGDFYIDDDGTRHNMDRFGRILGVYVVGKTVDKAGVLARDNAEAGWTSETKFGQESCCEGEKP